MEVKIGLNKKSREEIAEGLAEILADTYTLYLKTQKFHWNVTGPHFRSLHLMFEEQYTELALACDEMAERIRALGMLAPGSYSEFSKLAAVKESVEPLKADAMVKELTKDHETIVARIQKIFPVVTADDDQATLDLFIQRLRSHEKTAWMLRSVME